jgi:uncharacterized protein (TIGR03086 family)
MSADIDLLDRMIDRTADLIDGIGTERLERPTPCTRFTVGDLLDHLVGWAHVFEAATNELDVSRDPTTYEVDTHRGDAFRRAGHAAVAGLREGGVDRDMVMTTNPIPGTMVRDMMTMEYPGHGWDLAVATEQAYPFTDEEVEAAHRAAERMIQPPFRGQEEGQFRPVVDTPAGASSVARYVAFLGRDPFWAP